MLVGNLVGTTATALTTFMAADGWRRERRRRIDAADAKPAAGSADTPADIDTAETTS
ncbi:hypothetical protein [Streptomyces sp. TLI_053]|uniref:hypothetical protein n=1 Tax=Streptomyces sp. TLI_053 TaxID=1855352 RepID=UPI00135210E9|nr:hypothetical protein [Streptomyces sp. TLI_053]